MKNIHVLATDEPSRLFYNVGGALLFTIYENHNGVNIYITSDEEIKEGDWFHLDMSHSGTLQDEIYQMGSDGWSKTKTGWIHFCEGNSWIQSCKKIILTTEQDLIKDGVQAIDDEFLEWFVKNPSCERVEVKDLYEYPNIKHIGYKIVIPKEEPKQETLKEAAEKMYQTQKLNTYSPYSFKDAFKDGAKWQQERSYSEEEVEDLIYKVCGKVARLQGITLNGNHIDTAYKQFKNK